MVPPCYDIYLDHAQLRIGPYIFSWDFDCNPFARQAPLWYVVVQLKSKSNQQSDKHQLKTRERYPDPEYPVIQVPDRIYSWIWNEQDLRTLKQEIDRVTSPLTDQFEYVVLSN